MVTGTKETVFTQLWALLMEVKPYVLLDLFLMIWVLQELIYHEIGEAKPKKLAYGVVELSGQMS